MANVGEERKAGKDSWDKAESVAKVIAALLIPVSLAASGFFIESTLKQQASADKMIELAVGMMVRPPEASKYDEFYKDWAFDVMLEYSQVPFSAELMEAVRKEGIPKPVAASPEKSALQSQVIYPKFGTAFGAKSVASTNLTKFKTWSDFQSRTAIQFASGDFAEQVKLKDKLIQTLTEKYLEPAKPILEQPEAARNLIIALHKITTRKFRHILDRINYGKSDYWATPFEMLKNGGGDTEDFVLFEKDILLSMGFPANNLILVMYQDLNLKVVGMGLIVDLEEQGQFFIDSAIGMPTPPNKLKYIKPIYGLNDEYWLRYRSFPY